MQLNDQAVHLLFAMNRWERKEFIIETLKAGTNIVCDRYAYSGVCYSAGKGLDFDWCQNADKGLIKPDLVIYIKTTMATIQAREGFGDERYEKTDLQAKVREQYDKFEQLYASDAHWVTIEAGTQSIAEIQAEISKIVSSYALKLDENEDEFDEKLKQNLFV